jgi:shikimate kinase
MNIVLIGYRCSGKTRVARLLAGDLKRNFLDTDLLIEAKTGIPIPSYVSRYGWRDLRRVEREVVEAVALEDNSVIATGGGVVTDPENVINLRRNGWVVWLSAGAAVIRERMTQARQQGYLRPPLSGSDPLEEVDSILRERRPAYEQASDWTVSTDAQTPEEVERAIITALPYKFADSNGRTS